MLGKLVSGGKDSSMEGTNEHLNGIVFFDLQNYFFFLNFFIKFEGL